MSNDNFNLSNDQVLQHIRFRQQPDSADSRASETRLKFLICQLNDEWFGIEATAIREISRIGLITRVPNTPNYVLGVVNLRGNITAVVDIRDILGLERRPLGAAGRIVVGEVDNVQAGIVVEAVVEVAEVRQSQIEPPLLTLGQERALYSTGVMQYNKQLLILLNLPVILEKLKV